MFTFKVNTKTFDICIYDSIETIALFGSCARNENDDYSDIDLLIIADDCSDKKYNILKNDLLEQLKIPHDWLSMYTITSVNEMNKYSSYFLWNLKN
jgi:predicted nucleotidyltransferase